MKKIIILLLCLCMLHCPILGNAADMPTGFNGVNAWADSVIAVERQGRIGWITDITNGKYNIYADIDDALLFNNSRNLIVNITYYDEGMGCFTLQYEKLVGYATSEIVRLTGTNQWITKSFLLKEAVCKNGVSNADFIITVSDNNMGTSPENVIIGGIDVSPIAFDIKDTGVYQNIYDYGDAPIFECASSVISTSAETAKIDVYITNSAGTVFYSKINNISLDKKLTVYNQHTAGILEAGKYEFSMVASVNGKSFKATVPFYISNSNAGLDNLGISSHFSFQTTHKLQDLELMQKAGFKMVRDGCLWSKVETVKEKYEIPQELWDFIETAEENGLEPVIVLSQGNTIYTADANDMPTTTTQIEAFAKFCSFVATQLKGRVKYYEVWNEPDQDLRYTMAQYVALLKEAHNAITVADTDAYVIGISAASILENVGVVTMYIDRAMNAGAGESMDAISIHPYPYLAGSKTDNTTSTVYDECSTSYADIIDETEEAISGYDLDIWITETGYSTPLGNDRPLSEELQGAYLVRTLMLYKADGRASKLFIYDMKDESFVETKRKEKFGILRADSTPKPSYYMLASATSFLNGMEYCDRIVNKEAQYPYKGYSVYKFNGTGGKEVYALWTTGGNSYNVNIETDVDFGATVSNGTLTVDLSASNNGRRITVYDEYGSKVEDTEFTVNAMPKYIVCENYPVEISREMNISENNGNLKISGYADVANQQITLRVRYLDGNKTDYIDQFTADNNGYYSYNCQLDSKLCVVYVNDGTLNNRTIDLQDISVVVEANGKEINSVSQINKGDSVTATLSINKSHIADGTSFFCATYKNGQLVSVKEAKVMSNGASIGLTVDSEITEFRFFLLDSQLQPFMDRVDIK